MTRKQTRCPITCNCLCHSTGGGITAQHSPNGTGICPGKTDNKFTDPQWVPKTTSVKSRNTQK